MVSLSIVVKIITNSKHITKKRGKIVCECKKKIVNLQYFYL